MPKKAKRPVHDGEKLIAIAKKAAKKAKESESTLTRSAAMAAAPWLESYSPAFERAFREAYADALAERELAKPRRTGTNSGPSVSDESRASRGIGRLTLRVSQKSIDKFTEEAERIGCSRAALFEAFANKL